MRRLPTCLVCLVAVLAVLLWGRESRADVKLDGRWKQSPLREDYTVQTWLNAQCGPPPSSSATGGGEIVDVRTEGDELVFVGGGRVYRTNACYDPMPNLQRGAHTRDPSGKSWRTRCTTAPNDPRSAVLNTYVVAATDTHMDLVETGRYEITLEGGKCVADIKRTRSFDKVADDSAPAAVTASATAPPSPAKTATDVPRPALCGIVGDPTKLEVRPSRKLLRPGEAFHFNGAVLDAKGCETKTATTWHVSADGAGKGVKVDAFGNVTATPDAGEGSVDIIATAAGRDARVTVEIVSAARYDELLARSGLNAEGENDEASTATIATSSIGAGDTSVEDHSKQRRLTFLAIIGVLLAGLVIAGVRRSFARNRRAKAIARAGGRAPRRARPGGARTTKAPRSGARRAAPGARGQRARTPPSDVGARHFLPSDGTRAVARDPSPARAAARGARVRLVRPRDGSGHELLPARRDAARRSSEEAGGRRHLPGVQHGVRRRCHPLSQGQGRADPLPRHRARRRAKCRSAGRSVRPAESASKASPTSAGKTAPSSSCSTDPKGTAVRVHALVQESGQLAR